jgi:putative transposase
MEIAGAVLAADFGEIRDKALTSPRSALSVSQSGDRIQRPLKALRQRRICLVQLCQHKPALGADPSMTRRVHASRAQMAHLSADRLTAIGAYFDPAAEVLINERMRPHWSQAGAVVFVTLRCHDSIPAEVIDRWHREKNDWIDRASVRLGVELRNGKMWHDALSNLPGPLRDEFQAAFQRQKELTLDQCLGKCYLRRPALAQIVRDALLKFDEVRYRMGDFIVMPNHVHLLAAFGDPESMESRIAGWMRFTARRINQLTGETGHFWQQEAWDHLVRSPDQYAYLRQYIHDNPLKAGLKAGEYLYRRGP